MIASLRNTARAIDGFNERIGRIVAWLTLAMVIVTFVVVVLRYGFDLGWIAMQEAVTYMHALVFTAGAAYTLRYNEHVRIDIFYRNMGPAVRAWVNLTGTLVLLLPVSGYILWASWDYVMTAWTLKEGSREAGGLPFVYLLKSCIPLMGILLMLQGLSVGCQSLLTIITKTESSS